MIAFMSSSPTTSPPEEPVAKVLSVLHTWEHKPFRYHFDDHCLWFCPNEFVNPFNRNVVSPVPEFLVRATLLLLPGEPPDWDTTRTKLFSSRLVEADPGILWPVPIQLAWAMPDRSEVQLDIAGFDLDHSGISVRVSVDGEEKHYFETWVDFEPDDYSRFTSLSFTLTPQGEYWAENGIVPPKAAEPSYRFVCKGDYWEIVFGHEKALPHDSKGLQHIARLLANPCPTRPIPALDLMGSDDRFAHVEHSVDKILDDEAKLEYKKRLREIDDELTRAKTDHKDLGDAAIKLVTERDQIKTALNTALGLRGRTRHLGGSDPARAASAAVRQALNRAYDKMNKTGLQKLASHLKTSIKPERNAFAYRPNPPLHWDI